MAEPSECDWAKPLLGLVLQFGIGCLCDGCGGVKVLLRDEFVFCLPEALLQRKDVGAFAAWLGHDTMESRRREIRLDPDFRVSAEAVKLTFLSAVTGIPYFALASCHVDSVVESVFLMEQYCCEPQLIDAAVDVVQRNAAAISLDCACAALQQLSRVLGNHVQECSSSLESLGALCAAKVASETSDFGRTPGLHDFSLDVMGSILQHIQGRVQWELKLTAQSGPAVYSDSRQEVQSHEVGDWRVCAHFTEDFAHLTVTNEHRVGIYQFVASGQPSLLHKRIRVLWSRNKWYAGMITNVTPCGTHHTVHYDDGDRRTYDLKQKTFQIWDGQQWQNADQHFHRCVVRYGKRFTAKYDQVLPRSDLHCAIHVHPLELQFRAVVAWLTPQQDRCFGDPVLALRLYKQRMDADQVDEDTWRSSVAFKVLLEYVAFAMVQSLVSLHGLEVRDVEALLAHPFHTRSEAEADQALHAGLGQLLNGGPDRNELFVLQAVLEWALAPPPLPTADYTLGSGDAAEEQEDNRSIDDNADLGQGEAVDENPPLAEAPRPTLAELERLVVKYIKPHIGDATSESCFRFFRRIPASIRQQCLQHRFLEEIAKSLAEKLRPEHSTALILSAGPGCAPVA